MTHKNRHIIKSSLALITIALMLSGCKKFIAIDPPVNQVVSDVVFTEDGMATSAVTGIYSEMMNFNNQFSASGVTLFAGMAADELYYYTPGFRDEFIKNQITEVNHPILLSYFWERPYRYIYAANLCLEKLDQSPQLTPLLKNRLMGECRFIRAFCYFHLVNLFGDVPLAVVSDYRVNATLPRTTVSSVYDQITNDLQSAEELLSEDYPTTDRVRPNKWAAASLLARVYLYRNDWVRAEARATEVINAGIYSLASPDSVFLKSSKEAIWQLLPVVTNNNNTWEGNLILPPTSSPGYFVTDTLIKSFEANDLRKTNWTASRIVSGQTLYYPFKYKVKTSPVQTEYYMVFRLAEQYLIRAEARAKQNKLTEAVTDIDSIRKRAGLPFTIVNSQAAVLSAIEQERKIEFFAEWGNRWYDLKRTNRVNTVLSGLKPLTWQATDALWPIPVSQIRANPALTQNPGY